MYWRNNLNYDNYDWLYDTPVKDSTWEYKKRKEANEGILLGKVHQLVRVQIVVMTEHIGIVQVVSNQVMNRRKYYYCATGSK